MTVLFTRVKNIVLAMILLIPLFMPYGQTALAYGVSHYENNVDIGKGHFVVLKGDGSVWSWGDATYGQLGVRLSSLGSSKPEAIRRLNGERLANITSIAAGGYHTVALDKNNKVWTWGRNSNGQLGYETKPIGTTDQMDWNDNPRIVEDKDGKELVVKAISAGNGHTLAVGLDGRVWSWGLNTSGQLGRTGTTHDYIPLEIPGLANIVAVAAGAEHSLALTAEGTVYGWGRNSNGQLGNGQSGYVNPVPEKIERLTGIMEIAAGDNHTLALKNDRTTIWAWGSNVYGQIGDGGREDKLFPVQVQGINGVKRIAAGNDHTIAIKDDGGVWTWGRNTSGTQESRTTPIQVKGVNNAIAIGGGGTNIDSYTLAIHQDGTVWKWDQTSSDPTFGEPIFKQVNGISDVMKPMEYPFVQAERVLFKYEGTAATTDVKVLGSFNDMIGTPLVRNGNVWTLQTELPPGKYEYGFMVDGTWVPDPLNRLKEINNIGDTVSILKVDQYAKVTPIISDKEVTFTYSSYDYTGQFEFDAETSYVAIRSSFNGWTDTPLVKQPNNTWSLTRTLAPGEYTYEFVVRDRQSGTLTDTRRDILNPNTDKSTISGIVRSTFTVEEKILTKVPVENVELDRGPLMDMVVGEQTTLQATISPSTATNKEVSWQSSNPSVVSVDETGRLAAYSQGTAVIVVSSVDGGKIDTVTVTVHKQDGAIPFPRLGYKTFTAPQTGVAPNKVWYIKFSEELDLNSFNASNAYVLDENGERIPVGYNLSNGGQTVEISLLGGNTYKPGATYYLFIEDTVKTKLGGKKLKEKVQMQFSITLERALTEVSDSPEDEDIIDSEDLDESIPEIIEQ